MNIIYNTIRDEINFDTDSNDYYPHEVVIDKFEK